jgi:hypothetical protein
LLNALKIFFTDSPGLGDELRRCDNENRKNVRDSIDFGGSFVGLPSGSIYRQKSVALHFGTRGD